MKQLSTSAMRVTLGAIAVFHVVFGLGFMFSKNFQGMATALYGVAEPWSNRDVYFTRVIGSFAFVLGCFAAAAARDPRRYRIVVWGFVEFFILRDIHRHVFQNELVEAFGVTPDMNLLTTVTVGLIAGWLLLLLYLTRENQPTS